MTTIAKLNVELDATTVKFRKEFQLAQTQITKKTSKIQSDFKKTERRVNSSTKRMKRDFSALKSSAAKLAAPILAAFGVGAIIAFTKSIIDSSDNMIKFSQRVGIGVEELSALSFVMDRSGGSMSELQTSLQFLSRNISDASKGIGEAKDAFKEMGLNIDRLRLKPLNEQFFIILEALSRVENQTDKVNIAMKIFGRSGGSTLQIIADGFEGAEKLQKDFLKTGRALTKEQAESFAKFKDAITDLSFAFKNLAQELAPLIDLFTVFLETTLKIPETLEKISSFRSRIGKSIAQAFGISAKDIQKAQRQIDQIRGIEVTATRLPSLEEEERLNAINKAIEDVQIKTESMRKQFELTFETISRDGKISTAKWSDDLADRIFKAKLNFRSLGDFATNIFNDIAKQIIRQQVTDPLVNLGTSFITGLIPGFTSKAPKATKTTSPIAGARADGGPVSSGNAFLVGERGAELFTPNISGQITSSEDIRGAMRSSPAQFTRSSSSGGGGQKNQIIIQQTLNFTTDVKRTVQEEIIAASPIIASQAEAAVFESIRKGGVGARAVGARR